MSFAKLWRASAPEAVSTPAGKARHHPGSTSVSSIHRPVWTHPDTQHQCGFRITFFPGDIVLFSFANKHGWVLLSSELWCQLSWESDVSFLLLIQNAIVVSSQWPLPHLINFFVYLNNSGACVWIWSGAQAMHACGSHRTTCARFRVGFFPPTI